MLVREAVLESDDIHEHLGAHPFNDDEFEGLESYQDKGDRLVNGYLRGHIKSADSSVHKKVGLLDSAFSKVPSIGHSIVLHRGVRSASDHFGPVGSKIGQTFHDKGYTSTSTEKDNAREFLYHKDSALLTLHPHPNAKAISLRKNVDERVQPEYPELGENEVLLHRGSKWRVHSDSIDPTGQREIHLYQLDPGV